MVRPGDAPSRPRFRPEEQFAFEKQELTRPMVFDLHETRTYYTRPMSPSGPKPLDELAKVTPFAGGQKALAHPGPQASFCH